MNQEEMNQQQLEFEALRLQIRTRLESTPVQPNIDTARDLQTVDRTIVLLECARVSYKKGTLVPAVDTGFQSSFIPVTIELDHRPLFTINIAASLPLNGGEPDNANYAFSQDELLAMILRYLPD